MKALQTPILVWAMATALIACGDDSVNYNIEIEAIDPDRGPVLGGTSVTVTGNGFLAGGAPPNTVLVDGIAATNVMAIDDSTLTFTTPAGAAPGSVSVLVFNDVGVASQSDLFTYAELPVISSFAPIRGAFSGGTEVTLTGTGFAGFDVGNNVVMFGERQATTVTAVSDTELRVTAPPGDAFTGVTISVDNPNGQASAEGFSFGGGLLLFGYPLGGFPGAPFSVYLVEPATGLTHVQPDVLTGASRPSALASVPGSNDIAVFTTDGEINYCSLLDFSPGSPAPVLQRSYADPTNGCEKRQSLAYHQGTLYSSCKNCGANAFASIDSDTGELTSIDIAGWPGDRVPLASDGTNLYGIDRSGSELFTIDVQNGTLDVVADLAGNGEMRALTFHDGVLYAIDRNPGTAVPFGEGNSGLARVVTIDIATGAIDTLTLIPPRVHTLISY